MTAKKLAPAPHKKIDLNEGLEFLEKPTDNIYRKYQTDINHEPVIEIAGKQIELEDVETLPFVLPQHYTSGYRFADVGNPNGHWRKAEHFRNTELKFKRLKLEGLEIYITNGSSLKVSEELSVGYRDTDKLIRGDKANSLLVIVGSSIKVSRLTYNNLNLLANTAINGRTISLIEAEIIDTSFRNDKTSIVVDKSSITNCYFDINEYMTICDSFITDMRVSGVDSLLLEYVSGGQGVKLYGGYNLGKYKTDINIIDQSIRSFALNNIINNFGEAYTPEVSFPGNAGHLSLNIKKRVDYGIFTAIEQHPFVRVNDFDITVGGVIFNVKDFFPDYLNKRAAPEVEKIPSYYRGFAGTEIHQFDRNSKLWKQAAAVVYNGHKPVLGQQADRIISSLLEQIKSRIGLYVELSNLGG